MQAEDGRLMRRALLLIVLGALLALVQDAPALAKSETGAVLTAEVKIDPSRLIVRPKGQGEAAGADAPDLLSDPVGWIQVKQRAFYDSMSASLKGIRGQSYWSAAFMLMAMS